MYRVGDKVITIKDNLNVEYGSVYELTSVGGTSVTVNIGHINSYPLQYEEVAPLPKVGDTVLIRQDLVDGEQYGSDSVVEEMLQYRGQYVTVEEVTGHDRVYILEDDENWAWTYAMFDYSKRSTGVEGGSPDKVTLFRESVVALADLYETKNKDYGDSFGKSIEKYGLIAGLTRISDKFNRLEQLVLSGEEANHESLEDTLDDLSSYAQMLKLELK